MGPPRLPAELTDRIIDFCHNDKRTLKNCALVHSSWLPASRLHLFCTITPFGVRERTSQVTRFESILTESPSSLSIIPYIKIVEIESLLDFDQGARLIAAIGFAEWVLRCRGLSHLPAPSVHVSQGLSRLDTGDTLSSSLSRIGDIVTRLKLSQVIFARRSDIWTLLSSFPQLHYLELSEIGFYQSTEISLPEPGLFAGVPLSTLRMTTASMGFVISSLVRVAGSLSHLNDFGIAYQDIRQEGLLQLAEAVRKRVKCLRFSASCYPGDENGAETRPSAFDISEPMCPRLSDEETDSREPDRNPAICCPVSVTQYPCPR